MHLASSQRAAGPGPLAAVLAAMSLAAAAGCATHEPLPVPPPPAVAEPARVAVPDAGVALVIRKGMRQLELYRDGNVEKAFPVVLGPRPEGRKRFQGDMRTPEGMYRVSEKKSHERWQFFIGIDYPNPHDQSAYERDLEAGLIPVIDGERVPVGGGLGIHGNDRPEDQIDGTDWTRGCIAMRNADVGELYRSVDIGTPVLVIP